MTLLPYLLLLFIPLALLAREAVERRLVYKPTRRLTRRPEEAGVPCEEVWITAADGVRLHAWWFPRPDAIGTLLFCHGNTGNVADRLWLVEDLRDLPVNLLLPDYRGYGNSGGSPSLRGIDLDMLAIHDWLRARHGVEHPPLVVWGRSLGGAIAARLAAVRPPRGLILECTFTRLTDLGRRLYPWLMGDWLSRNRYDTLSLLPSLRVPLLIAHSEDDERIPFDMGQSLHAAAGEQANFFRLRGPHSEAGWRTTPAYKAVFTAFVRNSLATRPG